MRFIRVDSVDLSCRDRVSFVSPDIPQRGEVVMLTVNGKYPLIVAVESVEVVSVEGGDVVADVAGKLVRQGIK